MTKACSLALATLVLALLAAPGCGISAMSKSSLVRDMEAAPNRPVSKVITLLKDMMKQLQSEHEADQEVYDKLACWCTTNDKAKTKAISDNEEKIEQLTAAIEAGAALSAQLNTEIAQISKKLEEDQAALDKATAIREKEVAEFNAEEKDLLESISSLKAAITVLEKHNKGALLQLPRSHLLGIAAALQHQLQKHAVLLQGTLSSSQMRTLDAVIKAPEDFFGKTPTFKTAYAPQSGEIFGILTSMLDTFEANLKTAQAEEAEALKAYEALKKAKEAEIEAGKEMFDKKTEQLAAVDAKKAQDEEDKEDALAVLSADEAYLRDLKEKCQLTDKEWEARQKTRQDEMEAVSGALSVLSTDDAHDLQTRTFNPTLLQRETDAHSKRRSVASKLLVQAGHKFNSPQLVELATGVRLDAFTKVKKAIDDMMAMLLKEKEDEIKHKDWCTSELNANQLSTEKKTREKTDLEALIADLEATIKKLSDEIATLKSEITDNQVQLKRAGEDRDQQNKDFQMVVADQRASQELLKKALGFLETFYKEKAKAALLQRQEPAGPPPPEGFTPYKKNAASAGVISLIEQIIADAKAMEAESLKDEADAQAAYESFVKETNLSIETKMKAIVNKEAAKATAETDKAEADAELASAIANLEELSEYNAELRKACDFVLKNFDLRQEARDQEVEALKQAKAILNGANFEEFA